MEQRKLIRFGNNSFVISLPKVWIRKYNLEKGDTIFLSENETSLEIMPKEKKQQEMKSIVIDINHKPISRIQSEITAAYLQGQDIFEIRGTKLQDNAMKIKNILNNFSGIEIIEQTSEKIIAKDLMSFDRISARTIIKRIDIILRAMMIDSIETIKNKKDYESILQRDMDINRLFLLTRRIIKQSITNPELIKKQETTYTDLLNDYRTAGYLEAIGDSVKRISRIITKKKFSEKCIKELKTTHAIIQKRYLDVVKAYYTNNKELAYEIELESKQRIEICKRFRIKYPEATEIAFHLKSMTSDIKHIAREIIDTE